MPPEYDITQSCEILHIIMHTPLWTTCQTFFYQSDFFADLPNFSPTTFLSFIVFGYVDMHKVQWLFMTSIRNAHVVYSWQTLVTVSAKQSLQAHDFLQKVNLKSLKAIKHLLC